MIDSIINRNNDRYVVGYDMSDVGSQISYCNISSGEPETLSFVPNSNRYTIPNAICKRNIINQWYYGIEAIRMHEKGEGTLVTDLLNKARLGEAIYIVDKEYDPIALLALFIRRSFYVTGSTLRPDRIDTIMLSLDYLDDRMIEVFRQVEALLDMKNCNLLFQSREESIYYYNLFQPSNLKANNVLVYDCIGERLRSYEVVTNRRARPSVVVISENHYDETKRLLMNWESDYDEARMKELERVILSIAREELSRGTVSTVYLLGEVFSGDRMMELKGTLCRTSKVFQGNNLYSKGACYGARERIIQSPIAKNHTFLGGDKIRSNIGMEIIKQGELSYLVLANGGDNWYEINKEVEFILGEGNSFYILVVPLDKDIVRRVEVILGGLEERPPRTTRLRVRMEFKSVDLINIRIDDLGFGELYVASGQQWEKEIRLSV